MICIDLEASGLAKESYPIEIAWKCSETGQFDTFLIDPASVPEWEHWDEFAEEVHCIPPEMLEKDGIRVEDACKRLNDALAGRQVISDAWEYDSFWLQRLFDAAGVRQTFQLVGLDTVLTAEERIQYQLIARSQFRRHRALRDVEHLLEALEAAKWQAEQSG